MKPKFLLLAEVLGAVALALLGILGNPGVVRAAPLLSNPIQPWNPDTETRENTTILGATFINESLTSGPFGTRAAGSYWYNSGLGTPPDMDVLDGTQTGGIFAQYDLQCDAAGPLGFDTLAEDITPSYPPDPPREPWNEKTTAVTGTPEQWLLSAGPPYAVKWRLGGLFTVFYTSVHSQVVIPSGGIAVNLMGYTFPWAPKMGMTYVIIGDQANVPSQTCSDGPSDSDSNITGIFSNPAPEGDSGAPCPLNATDGKQCADKQIHGFWTQGRVNLTMTPPGNTITIPVTKRVLNNGPEVGSFTDIVDVELPPAPSVTASLSTTVAKSVWSGSAWGTPSAFTASGGGLLISFPETDVPVSVPIEYKAQLTLTCVAAGDYLVTLKDFTYPQPGTQDNDLSSNLQLYTVRVICGAAALTSTDLRIVDLKKTLTNVTPLLPELNLELPQTGEHIQLAISPLQTATVTVTATEINLSTAQVPSLQTLVAEAPPGISFEWVGAGNPIPGGLQWSWLQQVGGAGGGQFKQTRTLNIWCSAPGIYPIAIKWIDAPVGVGELKTADNVKFNVIKVWCWANDGDKHLAEDGVDDGSGFIVRWTVLAPRDDILEIRKAFDKNNPLALRSDVRYGERTVDPQCVWTDANGAPNQKVDYFAGYDPPEPAIAPWESQIDPNRKYGLDDDQDCLADANFVQPSHPVDEKDSLDSDLDGVSDAVEDVLGSDPDVKASMPEATLGASATLHDTCTDGVDNDLDGKCDTGACTPVLPADPKCDNTDADADGWAGWFETAAGSLPGNASSTPENLAAPTTCTDGVDNDSYLDPGPPEVIVGDGLKDGFDPGCIEADVALCPAGSRGALKNFNVHNDEDCDGLLDGVEKAWGSNPVLLDSDSDGTDDWVEMMAFTNPGDPDTDGDGLLDKPDDDYAATPYGGAAASVPESRLNRTSGSTPNWACGDLIDNDGDGRIDALDPGCATADQDSDTIADVDERGLESNPNNECMDQWDNKEDGLLTPDYRINDGCPAVGAAEIVAQCGNNTDDDWDGYINDGCAVYPVTPPSVAESAVTGLGTSKQPESPIAGTCGDGIDNDGDGKTDYGPPADAGCNLTDSDGDGFTNLDEAGLGSLYLDEYGETANSDDNCPYIYNPDQANNEGRPASNGPSIDGSVRATYNGDTLGDACDVDDDNDRAYDPAELQTLLTDPYRADTDGDRCVDGVESMMNVSPTNPAVSCGNLTIPQQYLFRACSFNLPNKTLYAGYSPGFSGQANKEMNPDGDFSPYGSATSFDCPFVSPNGDKDADDGASAFYTKCTKPPCSELEDKLEIEGYNTGAALSDSDGDGCEDWIEIMDINGDRAATGSDRLLLAQRLSLIPVALWPPTVTYRYADPVSDAVFDVDKNGSLSNADRDLLAKNSSLVKKPGADTVCNPAAGAPSTDLQRQLP